MKLKTLKSTLTTLKPTLRQAPRPGATERTRGSKWLRIRERWFQQHPLCEHCKERGIVKLAEELDHIIPLCAGGADDESNYQSLCVPCHKDKTTKDMGHTVRVATGLDGWPVG